MSSPGIHFHFHSAFVFYHFQTTSAISLDALCGDGELRITHSGRVSADLVQSLDEYNAGSSRTADYSGANKFIGAVVEGCGTIRVWE